MQLTTFENAIIGDLVWSFTYGWGVIRLIDNNQEYRISVEFAKKGTRAFTNNGKYELHLPQSLFWDEIKFTIPEQPIRANTLDYKIDDLIIIRESAFRRFSHFDGEFFNIYTSTVCLLNKRF